MTGETGDGSLVALADVFALDRDRATAAVVAMVALDAVWWTLLYVGAVPVPDPAWLVAQGIPMAAPGAMELAAFHVGTPRAFLGYLATWGVMMWAMMYVPMTRFTRDYAAALRGSRPAVAGTVASFLGGYSLAWALSGVVPLTLHALLPGGLYGFTAAHTHLAVGGALALTGLYQFTRFKQSRLRGCCETVAPRTADPASGFRTGATHGVECILVCLGPFFLLMPVFGEMNAFWMVALTTVVTAERLPGTWGEELSVATGAVALAAGLAVLLLQPPLPVAFAA